MNRIVQINTWCGSRRVCKHTHTHITELVLVRVKQITLSVFGVEGEE